ncbi:hypothetical protein [Nitratiruptor tergarcus]|uniref:LVIVD repeat-containing protein n=1 Tax=Nitratiruptor tergarcus DSM 16512 TaxID=1069081 RepID=A0A1W1WRD0_9BACT|nr:hypothetical protein [Nitratiruptor tergarcus]SMC08847.1 hypothetical protein SAMN05660197_0622 [Nitratiruptor tergarcus DSM 16512]
MWRIYSIILLVYGMVYAYDFTYSSEYTYVSHYQKLSSIPGLYNTMVKKGDTLFLSSDSVGLTVVNVHDKRNPIIVDTYQWKGRGLYAEKNKLYLAGRENGVYVLDIANVSQVQQRGNYSSSQQNFDVQNVWENNGYLFINTATGTFAAIGHVCWNGNCNYIQVDKKSIPNGSISTITGNGDFIYVTEFNHGVIVYKFAQNKLLEVASLSASAAMDTVVDGDYTFIASNDGEVSVYSMENRTRAIGYTTKKEAQYKFLDGVRSLTKSGESLFVGVDNIGVIELNVTNIHHPTSLAKIDLPGVLVTKIIAEGDYLYVLGNGDLFIYKYVRPSICSTYGFIYSLQNHSFPVAGYFYHFGEGAFDWLFVTATGNTVVKLEGMDAQGYLKWSDNLKNYFTSVEIKRENIQFSGTGEHEVEINFGNVLNKMAPGYIKSFSNTSIYPHGYFYHYGSGAYDWIYATSSLSLVAKLDGMDRLGYFKWRQIKKCFVDISLEGGTQKIIFGNVK